MNLVTIITPAYNRAALLPKLYASLKAQTSRDFDWLVIDDGSTDDTENVVSRMKAEADFTITYVKKKNGGKHTALNLGIATISAELTFIVDSDDYLTPDAVSTIRQFHEKYKSRLESDRICGYSFLRAYSDGTVNTGEYPVDEALDSFRNQRINNNLLGDKAEVYYTRILKKYPFEVFEGEKFMPEDAVWLKMSGPFNMVHINRVIYTCDYLQGGLTRTGRRMKIFSPYGMMYRSSVYINDKKVAIKPRLKMLLLYLIYERFAKDLDKRRGTEQAERERKQLKCRIRHGGMYYLLQPFAAVIYRKWKGDFENNRYHNSVL
jgi:glycosyltransferase involved in cell wall biosynthesis